MSTAARRIRERVIRFGAPGGGLAGVVCEPAERGERSERGDRRGEALVMLNSGILHRVGACRIHVKMARRLAAAGTTTLRFDHSGIGDSEARRDNLAFEESAPLEVRAALDWLAEKRGIERFVLFGLCSGADMAFLTARQDPRVGGLVLLDPWAYRTPRYWRVHYLSRVTSAAAWRRLLARGRRSAAAATAGAEPDPELDLPTYVRTFPPRAQAAADLAVLMERNVRLLCIFSGGQLDHYNHAGQMRASFRQVEFGERLEELFLPDADHIFTDLDQQRTLLESVESWLAGPSPAEAVAEEPGEVVSAASGA